MDWTDRLLTVFLGASALAVVTLVASIAYIVADSSNLTASLSVGHVTEKNYHPAYSSIVPISTGKTVMMLPQYHPERYSICVYVNATEQVGCADFSPATWEEISPGDEVEVSYTSGRFSGGTYLESIAY